MHWESLLPMCWWHVGVIQATFIPTVFIVPLNANLSDDISNALLSPCFCPGVRIEFSCDAIHSNEFYTIEKKNKIIKNAPKLCQLYFTLQCKKLDLYKCFQANPSHLIFCPPYQFYTCGGKVHYVWQSHIICIHNLNLRSILLFRQ